MRNKLKTFLFLFSIAVLIVAGGCRKGSSDTEGTVIPVARETEGVDKGKTGHSDESLPAGIGKRIRVINVGPFGQVFNDSNSLQLASARKYGIDPVTDLASAYFTSRPLVRISSNENFRLDSLTHSLPYLVPEAADLLNIIGSNFRDSLKARGGAGHLIKVTSLLRTPESVGRLRRININATDSSTHQYATTFDISYTNFYVEDSTRMVYQGDLKNLLAEILYDLRRQGKCLVKYERKTGCFHVTVAS